jgi:hypothetical protein
VVGDLIAVDSRSTTEINISNGASFRAITSNLKNIANSGRTWLHRSHAGFVNNTGDVRATSSVLHSDVNSDGPFVGLYHCTVVRDAFSFPNLFNLVPPSGRIEAVGTSFIDVGSTATLFFPAGAPLPDILLDNNNFGRKNPPIRRPLLANLVGVEVANANELAFFTSNFTANTDTDPAPFADDVHLAAGSPLIDRAVTRFPANAPPSVLIDLDGDCRYLDGSADVGADER